ncbi:DUF2061 domain-containing protein [Marinobacter orientalis]|uniref:DUF2061 domain-containing protein n=1 Tax=Marinobacter orientalis TaxID=1928859 RepID=A0A7Y0NJ36_9GAMM|nr:DUF2061 domain-containing protein [Marinobacter orientalis]TGX52039.1 DUF2061 domain-containing protein [Marinobacter orientalis]
MDFFQTINTVAYFFHEKIWARRQQNARDSARNASGPVARSF